jgi:hypothetical protein
MSTVHPRLIAAASVITVATILTSAPVQARPQAPLAPGCLSWTHTGALNIFQDNGLRVEIDNWMGNSAGTAQNNAKLFRANGTPVSQGDGTFTSDQTGTASGGNSGNKFDLTINWGSVSNHYTGTIDDMGSVNGTSVNSKGVSNQFNVEEHFTCAKQDAPAAAPAPAPAPAPAGAPAPAPQPPHDAVTLTYGNFSPATGLPVTVTNSSPVAGTCTYDSTPFNFHKDFSVPPNGKNTFNISGLPTGTTYHVVVSCNGTFNGQSIQIGHVETNKQF